MVFLSRVNPSGVTYECVCPGHHAGRDRAMSYQLYQLDRRD
jgi:hypothetical protein